MNRTSATSILRQTDSSLQKELERLKRVLGSCQELKVKWIPDVNSNLSGEVKGSIICIYEEVEERALATLRHEFIEYILTYELVAPYKKLVNKLISLFEEEMYERKEKLIEKFLKAI